MVLGEVKSPLHWVILRFIFIWDLSVFESEFLFVNQLNLPIFFVSIRQTGLVFFLFLILLVVLGANFGAVFFRLDEVIVWAVRGLLEESGERGH